jgi:hypothetical protein
MVEALFTPTATPLREVRLPEATRDLVMAWLFSAFGCELGEASCLNALSLAVTHDHGPRTWFEGESEVLKFGKSRVVSWTR